MVLCLVAVATTAPIESENEESKLINALSVTSDDNLEDSEDLETAAGHHHHHHGGWGGGWGGYRSYGYGSPYGYGYGYPYGGFGGLGLPFG